ncbi:MAG TPA: BMP family ABC transporter substrate-binding protein [Ilumatobacteraceae bacterium]
MNIRRLAPLVAAVVVMAACGSSAKKAAPATVAPAATTAAAATVVATTPAGSSPAGSTPASGSAAPVVSGPIGAGQQPGKGATTIGFIFVGPKDDYGYNQAAYEGSQAVAKAHPDIKVLTAENVPEDDNATRVMEKMIADGATIIFATSYGHLDPALKVAAAHPNVAVVQQGNVIQGTIPANAGTYFGTVYEPVFLAGIAAGKATKSNKLGYVYAFPIPQTIANINAFELGAKMVNPKAETYTVNTSSWCDPAKQAQAAASLFAQGVDVITQHQDCTATITKAAEAAGKYVVGYHADASALAPKGWLTGSEWSWGDLYNKIVDTTIAGNFTGSVYNANYRVGYKDGGNPFVQSKYGPSVTDETKALIAAQLKIISTTGSPFTGPVLAQDGSTLFAAGDPPPYADIESKNTKFVQGVVGQLPSS